MAVLSGTMALPYPLRSRVAAVTINPEFVAALIQIIWINIILSGDNAVVIAMACRDLPAKTKNKGIILGAAAAIGLRRWRRSPPSAAIRNFPRRPVGC